MKANTIEQFLTHHIKQNQRKVEHAETVMFFVTIPNKGVRDVAAFEGVSEDVKTVIGDELERYIDHVQQAKATHLNGAHTVYAENVSYYSGIQSGDPTLYGVTWAAYHTLENEHQVDGMVIDTRMDAFVAHLAEELARDDTQPQDVYIGLYQWMHEDLTCRWVTVDNLQTVLKESLTYKA